MSVTVTFPDVASAQAAADVIERHMAAQANWLEAAVLRGDGEGVIKIAEERRDMRSKVFAPINAGIMGVLR